MSNVRDRLIGAGQIRFVDDDDIGDLEDTGFFPLQLVAGLRLHDEYNRVGYSPDRRIGLAGADGLNKDTVKPKGFHQVQHEFDVWRDALLAGGSGQASHENSICGVITTDSAAVAEQSAAGY